MNNIIKLNTYRRQNGQKFQIQRKQYYNLALRFSNLGNDARRTDTRTYAVTRAFIDELGGFRLARGFKKEKMSSGEWHTLVSPVESQRVRSFLEALDEECAMGLIEVRVDDQIMGATKQHLQRRAVR